MRLFKLFRFNDSLVLLKRAFTIVKREMLVFSFIAVILLYISSVGIYYFEHELQPDAFRSIFDCMWWAVCTMTTVGYGDMAPTTDYGRFLAVLIMISGIILIAIITATISSTFVKSISGYSLIKIFLSVLLLHV